VIFLTAAALVSRKDVLWPPVAWVRIWSAVLVQTNGSRRSFQPSMKARIAAMRA
jgi:hypothetical protein